MEEQGGQDSLLNPGRAGLPPGPDIGDAQQRVPAKTFKLQNPPRSEHRFLCDSDRRKAGSPSAPEEVVWPASARAWWKWWDWFQQGKCSLRRFASVVRCCAKRGSRRNRSEEH